MAQGVKHDYHLVNPSPWPFVGSVAATVMFMGLVVWMKGAFGLEKGTWWIFAAGFAGVLYTMLGWWIDVTKEANQGDHTPVVSIGLRYGMILFIASEVMFFVAWFWIFFEMSLFHEHRTLSAIAEVRDAWAQWPPAGVELVPAWHLPLVNTLTLLLSGTTVTWAHHALQQGDRKGAKLALLLTVILGALFTAIQVYEYNHIIHENLFFSEEAANAGLYGSSFFMATGFHGFHVLVGTIFLIVCLLRLMGGGFTPKQHFGFEAAAWYWHFVDVVWLFLFAFIYVIFEPPVTSVTGRPANPFVSGLAGRCPNCGKGKLFAGFLTVVPVCTACDFPLAKADSGDGPAVFIILIVGFLMAFGALFTEVAYRPPVWVHLVIWMPLTVVLCLALLRPMKGLLIAAQFRNHASEAGRGDV